MPDYLVQEEDGSSRLTLEEADGFLLLEDFFDLADGECAIELGDGSGFIELGDGTGVLLLAQCPPVPVVHRRGGRLPPARTRAPRRRPEVEPVAPAAAAPILHVGDGVAYLTLHGRGVGRRVYEGRGTARFELTGSGYRGSPEWIPRAEADELIDEVLALLGWQVSGGGS